jgi:hypothetical protein
MGVGTEMEATCGRCGAARHVVIAMVGGRIAQVECRLCGSRHRLRGAKSEAAAPKPRKGAATARKRVVVTRPLVEPDPSRPPCPYLPAERYAPADRIEHPRFGLASSSASSARQDPGLVRGR